MNDIRDQLTDVQLEMYRQGRADVASALLDTIQLAKDEFFSDEKILTYTIKLLKEVRDEA
jgi:hypothetical protein